jgi:hypothetical protein
MNAAWARRVYYAFAAVLLAGGMVVHHFNLWIIKSIDNGCS